MLWQRRSVNVRTIRPERKAGETKHRNGSYERQFAVKRFGEVTKEFKRRTKSIKIVTLISSSACLY